MTKKAIGVLAACISVFFVSCGKYWEEIGIFWSIEHEIELDEGVVRGNVFSIVELDDYLYASGGPVYRKNKYAVQGWSKFSSAPYGKVIRLAVSNGSLYALCAEYETYKIYHHNGGWTEDPITMKDTLFPNTISASDGTNTFSPSTPGLSGISDITSLWACDGKIYIGTEDGPKNGTISGDTVSNVSDIVGSNAGAIFNGYENGAVYARLSSGGRTDIYISTIGRGSTLGSDENGLWGYYSDRDNWNRE
jgi:hypothetical protein